MGHLAGLQEVLNYYNLNNEEGLHDCGCAGDNPNLEMLFPKNIMGRWATVMADTDVTAPNFNYANELVKIAAADNNAKTKMALFGNLDVLKDKYFMIDKLEFFAYDKDDSSIAPNWLQNYFNPQFYVNEYPLIGGLGANSIGKNDTSGLGLALPMCISFRTPLRPAQNGILVQGQLRKQDGNTLRHYPLVCNAVFKYR